MDYELNSQLAKESWGSAGIICSMWHILCRSVI